MILKDLHKETKVNIYAQVIEYDVFTKEYYVLDDGVVITPTIYMDSIELLELARDYHLDSYLRLKKKYEYIISLMNYTVVSITVDSNKLIVHILNEKEGR